MRISRIDVFAKKYTFPGGPFVMSGGKVASEQDATIVRIETDTGHVGWGEQCGFSPRYIAAHGEGARSSIALMAPALIGQDPRALQRVYDIMDGELKGHGYAKAAIDMACWDLLGRSTGLPLCDLLGGSYATSLPLYTGIGIGSPEEMQESCRRALAEGYRRFQVKVGSDVPTDIARVKACMEVLGDAETVIIDSNGYWSQRDAVRVLGALDGYPIHIEQPCATLEQCASLRHVTRHPIILDECIGDFADIIRGVQLNAMDAVMMKLSRHGGITPIRRARDLCIQLGVSMTIEESGGGDIVSAAMAHIAASVPKGLLVNAFLIGRMVSERLATNWSPLDGGGFGIVPMGPGLGIEIDESRLGAPVFSV